MVCRRGQRSRGGGCPWQGVGCYVESGLGAYEVPPKGACGPSVDSTVWGGGADSRLPPAPQAWDAVQFLGLNCSGAILQAGSQA